MLKSFGIWKSRILRACLKPRFILTAVAIAGFNTQATANIFNYGVANDCSPLAVDTCALPFPSDVFRTANWLDETTQGDPFLQFRGYKFGNAITDTRTSGVIRILENMVRSQFPVAFQPAKIFNKSSGFSPLGPVLFELEYWPYADLPENGDGYLHVYNISTGERVPMLVSLSEAAKGDGLRVGRPVIEAWPVTRFEFGEKYVAVLFKDRFNADEGSGQDVFKPTEGVLKALYDDLPNRPVLRQLYQEPMAALTALEIDRDNVLSFTWFTVRQEAEVVQPMLEMIETAKSYGSSVSNLKVATVQLGDAEHGLVTLSGRVGVVNFRSTDGGIYPSNPQRAPGVPPQYKERVLDSTFQDNRTTVEFSLTLPKEDDDMPIPVSIWGHGLGSGKDFLVSKGNFELGDQLGMATIGIDHPNHGTRVSAPSPGSSIFNLGEPYVGVATSTPLTVMHLLGMFVQSVVDHNMLVHAIKYNLPQALNSWDDPDYPDVPKLDTSRVMYDGISLGAMIGSAIGATVTDLDGAYLVNGSGSLTQALLKSTFWDLTNKVAPLNMNGAELMFVVAMMQHYLDFADGNNFAHLYRNPPEGFSDRALGLHYALGDGSYPNSGSLATAKLVDLPAVAELEEPIADIRFGDTGGRPTFENGFGLVQSGYGLASAEVATNAFVEQDIEKILALAGISTGANEVTNAFSYFDFGSEFEDILDSVLGNNRSSVDDYLDLLDSGEITDFLTHFNRGNENARHRQIDWRCDLLNLNQDRCAMAKQLATEDVERIERGELINVGDLSGEDDPSRGVDDLLGGDGVIQVTEGSAGSINGWFLVFMLLGWGLKQSAARRNH